MGENPSVSIIIVNYNGMGDTIECISSLLKVSYDNFNIVIVDNGSSQREKLPVEYLENSRIHYIWEDENHGFAGGNNIGCRYAIEKLSAEYLLLLNNDTVVNEDFLSKMMVCAEKCGPQTAVTGKIYYESNRSKLWYYGGKLDLSRGLAIHYTDESRYEGKKYPRVSYASGCLLLLSSQAYKGIDGIAEEYFLYYEDDDLCCALREQGYELRLCTDAVIYHKVNAATGTKSDLSVYYGSRNRLYFVEKYGTNKLKGYISAYAMCFRRILRHPFRSKVVWQAIKDYRVSRMGKRWK